MENIVSTLQPGGNDYERVNRDSFLIFPRLRDIQSTSFLAVQDLALMPADETNSMKIIDKSDTKYILNKIKKEDFRREDL